MEKIILNLGDYKIGMAWSDDEQDYVAVFYREGSEDPLIYPDGDTYLVDEFVPAHEDAWFDGYMSESSVSEIICKLGALPESAKLFKLYVNDRV
jgi:hypothetical protein